MIELLLSVVCGSVYVPISTSLSSLPVGQPSDFWNKKTSLRYKQGAKRVSFIYVAAAHAGQIVVMKKLITFVVDDMVFGIN